MAVTKAEEVDMSRPCAYCDMAAIAAPWLISSCVTPPAVGVAAAFSACVRR
jgi:hypothetical protein